MKITFFYEFGKKKEIGMGHKYRVEELTKELTKRGHKIEHIHEDVIVKNWDMLIVDHVFSQKSMIERAKRNNMKTVLIDGAENDAELVDLSVSAFYNPRAQYRGIKYMVFPIKPLWTKYKPYNKNNSIFVAMGGYDYNNYAYKILDILKELNINAIIAKSINHFDFKQQFDRLDFYTGDNYYDVMPECRMAITNGGLSLFQCLFFGMPTISIPQYEHQLTNINGVDICCEPARELDKLKQQIENMWNNEYYRQSLSTLSQHWVDGKATKRVCDLIEQI